MKRAFFPLDERLGLGEHSWTPGTIQEALSLAVDIPSYRRAAQRYEELTHLGLSKSSLQRLCQEYGEQVVTQQAAEAEAMMRVPAKDEEEVWRQVPEPESEVMSLSMDGVMVHIRDEGWREVKIASISAVENGEDEESGEATVDLTHHSYRAGLWDAATFSKQQWAEACSRGVEKARQLVCVSDGAAWIWAIVLLCYAPCVEILDWWHAVERLWTLARSHFEGSEANEWVSLQKQRLAQGRLRRIFHHVRQLYPRGQPLPETVAKALGFLFRNRHRLRYREFRQAGFPIGSGTVESACKVVVQQRMKQAGMRWGRDSAQAMLALRCALLSDRWEQTWRDLRSLT